MIQNQMIEAGVQIEAGRELAALVRPLVQRIVRGVRSSLQSKSPAAPTALSATPAVQGQFDQHVIQKS